MPALPLLTRVQEFKRLECVQHMAAWPRLRELVVRVRPCQVTGRELGLLAAAAPGLRGLRFDYLLFGPVNPAAERRRDQQQLQRIRAALPGCVVESY